jgi:hypothetical protein
MRRDFGGWKICLGLYEEDELIMSGKMNYIVVFIMGMLREEGECG